MTELIFWQIVDSVIALFRVDFSGRGELADRQVDRCHLNVLLEQFFLVLYVIAFADMNC